jgi:uncharacterized protein YodC (DUF2158 family)
METDFKTGDEVRSKLGGPKMVVERTVSTDEGPKVCCRWFIASKPQEAHFPPSELELV